MGDASLRLPPFNLVLRDTLLARLAALAPGSDAPPALAVSLTEFDDFSYLLAADDAATVSLSLGLPVDPSGERGGGALPEGAAAAVVETYAPYGTVAATPAPGYALTLVLDLAQLAAAAGGAAAEAERCASLRAVVQGAPLRALLNQLATGAPVSDALVALHHRPGEAFFATRSDSESVTVVFPMRFADAADVVLARTFLAQFAEARRGGALSTAPSCSYGPSPPDELRRAPAALAQGANGGYVSLVLFKRHVAGGRRVESACWSCCTFYAFVAFHLKCSKAYMHSAMRRRAASLLQVLNRAKPEGPREKKTASGRTFKGAQ